ncbi:uroporphyrinogen-III synthase [Flexivirga oryzae]|uniref:Uroporphyrinogen-III synthase n=1 Tax=Flexivirga oryzae TaxID=1794944 RepID=A0A839NA71_9MICO|nr:uroporphyrinogen-III synthase [Flexivirga oryzae]MBB2894127.1 uroporphyrinogen-III synthase [Flexivirga oryzae]
MNPSGGQLLGCRVILTGQRRSAELAAALERRGATVEHAPTLSVVPHVDDAELLARTKELIDNPPDIAVISTGVGFTGWVEAADAAGLAEPLLDMLRASRLIARGPKARGAIQAAGLSADWVADSETSAEIRDFLLTEGVAGRRIAVQHHGAGSDGLDEAFQEAGAEVSSVVIYRWGPAPDPEAVRAAVQAVARRECDAVAFTAAPGAAAFLDAARSEGLLTEVVLAFTDPAGVFAAAVGDTTAAPLRAEGIEPLVPDRFRMGALVRTLVGELAGRHGLRVQTAAGELRVLSGAALLDGEVLTLSPSGLAVLRVLAEANGSVVSRGDILDALPGDSSDAHAAEVAISRLREATRGRPLVTTVVKRGYRLTL